MSIQAGVYRPPRLQPCLTVMPAPDMTAPLHSRAAALVSGPAAAAPAGISSQQGGCSAAALIRSRLGQQQWQPGGVQQQQQQQGLEQQPVQQQQQQLSAAASKGQVLGLGSGQLLPVQQGPKAAVKLSYYVRLLVNGRVVGSSEVLQLRDDFTLAFRDVFRWVARTSMHGVHVGMGLVDCGGLGTEWEKGWCQG